MAALASTSTSSSACLMLHAREKDACLSLSPSTNLSISLYAKNRRAFRASNGLALPLGNMQWLPIHGGSRNCATTGLCSKLGSCQIGLQRKGRGLKADSRVCAKSEIDGAGSVAGNGSAVAAQPMSAQKVEDGGPVIVWFKHDLRVDDHPGLVAAAAATSAVPLLVLDEVALAGLPKRSLPFFHEAIISLHDSLRRLGTHLLVREGPASQVIPEIARQVGAKQVVTEEEVEHTWRHIIDPVSSALAHLSTEQGAEVRLVEWRALLDDPSGEPEGLAAVPDSFREYQRASSQQRRVVRSPPLDAPAALPPLPPSLLYLLDLEEGEREDDKNRGLPSLGDLERLHARRRSTELDSSAEVVRRRRTAGKEGGGSGAMSLEQAYRAGGWGALRAWRKKYLTSDPYEDLSNVGEREGGAGSAQGEEESEEFVVQGGEGGAVEALQGYLRFLEATPRRDWQRLHRAILREEVRPGASFLSLFGTALAAGALSRRRVYYEALQYECAQSGGRLSPFGFSAFTAKAAARAAEAGDWHQLLGLKALHIHSASSASLGESESDTLVRGGVSQRYWRWRGALVQYIEGRGGGAGEEGTTITGEEGNGTSVRGDPDAVLFVHGFGAFAEHFRGNVGGLAKRGCRVWAVTLPGFGRSEKPAMAYSQDVWSDFVHDFIVNVVREPVVLAGNSIGGYVTASVAADHPTLVKSVVLLNSAGRVVDTPPPQSPPPSVPARNIPQSVAWLVARVLFLYLQSSSNKILSRCYPKNPERVNQWLSDEIIRASYDPGAVEVVESAFYLPKPRPLNHLLDAFPGPVLVLQGRLDPLMDASARAYVIQASCPKVTLSFVDAGHCPHDELPEEVNDRIFEWATGAWTRETVSLSEEEKDSAIRSGAGRSPEDVLEIIEEEVLL